LYNSQYNLPIVSLIDDDGTEPVIRAIGRGGGGGGGSIARISGFIDSQIYLLQI
jgi:acetyl-CoA carboxylase alpha subunit